MEKIKEYTYIGLCKEDNNLCCLLISVLPPELIKDKIVPSYYFMHASMGWENINEIMKDYVLGEHININLFQFDGKHYDKLINIVDKDSYEYKI